MKKIITLCMVLTLLFAFDPIASNAANKSRDAFCVTIKENADEYVNYNPVTGMVSVRVETRRLSTGNLVSTNNLSLSVGTGLTGAQVIAAIKEHLVTLSDPNCYK